MAEPEKRQHHTGIYIASLEGQSQARCTCGWEGTVRWNYVAVHDEGVRHRDTMHRPY